VAVPLEWRELDSLTGSNTFTIENVPQRLQSLRRDPWREFETAAQVLTKRMQQQIAKQSGVTE
jgi:bifunctional non-homologous end joining protein LigD